MQSSIGVLPTPYIPDLMVALDINIQGNNKVRPKKVLLFYLLEQG